MTQLAITTAHGQLHDLPTTLLGFSAAAGARAAICGAARLSIGGTRPSGVIISSALAYRLLTTLDGRRGDGTYRSGVVDRQICTCGVPRATYA